MYVVKFVEVSKVDNEEISTDRFVNVPGLEPALSLANLLARISTCDPSGQLIYRKISVIPVDSFDYETQKK